ncbi:MAG TPA: hypothetical protein VH309_05185 [Elusimicrobiota bacterium]|jgi:hypothetical protein|nr:hypothetical protein [Elusimicrobiota bacterium]
MKILITAAMAAALAVPAAAGEAAWAGAAAGGVPGPAFQVQGDHSVIRDETTVVKVDLNPQTVKCSAADYSGPMLKVLVPALADLTVLNHRNTREGAPCLAAGRCGEGVGPETILKSGDGSDEVPVRVVLKKLADVEGDVCHVSLVETVTANIRGAAFFHERRQAVADRTAADCR